MNLGHRMRLAEVKKLRSENARLRRRLAELTDEEIDLRDRASRDVVDVTDAADDQHRVGPLL